MIIFEGALKISPFTKYTYTFFFPCNSSLIRNDGCIGFGRTISEVSVIAIDSDLTDVTDVLIVDDPMVDQNIVYIKFQFPEGFGVGRYKIFIDITLDNNETERAIFENIFVEG